MPAARLVIQNACSVMTGSWSSSAARVLGDVGRGAVASRRGGRSSVGVVVRGRGDVVAPIEPSKATTPQARTKVASDGGDDAPAQPADRGGLGRRASPGRRRRACRDYRVARREPPARTLRGSWAMTTTVIFDLDGVLVDSRAVFLSCVNHAFDEARPAGPRRRGAAALHRPAVRLRLRRAARGRRTTRRSSTACIDGYRERYKTASLTETTVEPGIPEALDGARRPPARGRHLQAARVRRAAAGGDGPARPLRGRRRPRPQRPRRGQDRDARPRAARARPDPRRDGRRPLLRHHRRPRPRASRRSASPGASARRGELHDAGAERTIDPPDELPGAAAVLLDD